MDAALRKQLNDSQPERWSEEALECAKKAFETQRPTVSGRLVHCLWRYWSRNMPNRPLFETHDQNVALLIHARAFGEAVPDEGQDSFFGRLLREHRDLYKPPSFPRLAWGPSAVLSTELLVGPDAPALHAWVMSDRRNIQ